MSKKHYPLEIGGRDVDISQIGFTLRSALRDAFPINEVPVALKDKADALVALLVSSEQEIELFIDAVRETSGDFLQ